MICSRFKLKHTSITSLNTEPYALQSLFNLKQNSWQFKNGYAYLKSFTSFTRKKFRNLFFFSQIVYSRFTASLYKWRILDISIASIVSMRQRTVFLSF